jgi:bacteriocin-like protein
MTDQEQKKESTNTTPQPDAENKKTELSEEELTKVVGGDFTISKSTDPTSPK